MAEINIEKKKAVWPWVLLVLGIIALLLYFFVFKSNDDTEEKPAATSLIDIRENNNTVADFVTFINSDTNKLSLDHKFTNEALLKLTEAAKAMAGEVGFNNTGDLEKAKEYADKITNDPFETTHADNIRKSADIISRSLQNLQQAKYPELENEASEVTNASANINPETLTLDQRDAVKNFFAKAANLLEKMN